MEEQPRLYREDYAGAAYCSEVLAVLQPGDLKAAPAALLVGSMWQLSAACDSKLQAQGACVLTCEQQRAKERQGSKLGVPERRRPWCGGLA